MMASDDDLSLATLRAPRIRFIILCEYASVENQKLYMIGGGMNSIQVPNASVGQLVGIAIGFEVPWSAADRPFGLEIRLVDEDLRELPTIQGQAVVNPGGTDDRMKPGQPIIGSYAINLALNFPRSGTYMIVARIPGGDSDRAHLHVDVEDEG
jgi:hypothetical protein